MERFGSVLVGLFALDFSLGAGASALFRLRHFGDWEARWLGAHPAVSFFLGAERLRRRLSGDSASPRTRLEAFLWLLPEFTLALLGIAFGVALVTAGLVG